MPSIPRPSPSQVVYVISGDTYASRRTLAAAGWTWCRATRDWRRAAPAALTGSGYEIATALSAARQRCTLEVIEHVSGDSCTRTTVWTSRTYAAPAADLSASDREALAQGLCPGDLDDRA